MSLEKFSGSKPSKTKLTPDEKKIIDELKEKCREKGIDYKILIKKMAHFYDLP